jgi:protein TonB
MFDKLIESTTAKKKSRGGFFIATATVWMLTLSTIIVGGIFAFDAQLSDPEELKALITPVLPPPVLGTSQGPVVDRVVPQDTFRAYEQAPDGISDPQPSRPSVPVHTNISVDGDRSGSGEGSPYGVVGGVRDGVPFGVPGSPVGDAPPPQPRDPDPPRVEPEIPVRQTTPVRKISSILQGDALKRVEPSYPELARIARAQGTVTIEVTINEQGTVESARAMSGHPLLRDAALNAARAWRWNPTRLNGMAVKVIGTITFNFKL